jgi:hypothetical protein
MELANSIALLAKPAALPNYKFPVLGYRASAFQHYARHDGNEELIFKNVTLFRFSYCRSTEI